MNATGNPPRARRRARGTPFGAPLPAMLVVVAALGANCAGPASGPADGPRAAVSAATPGATAKPAAGRAWDTVYAVLQHPRCLNCHPAGNAPLQGEDSHVHTQGILRGTDGEGLFGQRCSACHMTRNTPGDHMPPGAPRWQLPSTAEPLVFEGRDSGELCRQLRDPAHNGGRTPAQLLEHMANDPLVRWGWRPGEGRSPVSVPREVFVEAVRLWVEGGCDCPD